MSRALVLGGGGPVGIAWESGLVAGFAEGGIDLREADRIVGTSAGSVVGARLALGRAMTRPEPPAVRADRGPGSDKYLREMSSRMAGLMEARAAAADLPAEEGRALIGRFALGQDTAPEERFLEGFADLTGAAWPATFGCTAVNAATGAFVVWDAAAGVDLQRAVASSCAVPGVFPPISVGGGRFIDGGMRSPLNADLVAGTDVVVVVSVVPFDLPGAAAGGELETLRSSCGTLELVTGGKALLELAQGGRGFMDAANGPAAYDLGRARAERFADQVGPAWAG